MHNSFSYFISHAAGIFCLLSAKSAPTIQHFRSLIKIVSAKYVNVRAVTCSFVYYKLSTINCAIIQTHR